MATIDPSGVENEQVLDIPVGKISCKVISGYANFVSETTNADGGPTPAAASPKGHPDGDDKWVSHLVRIRVGPEWDAISDVSPSVDVAGYTFPDSDDVDDSGYHIDTCTWEELDVLATKRIRLLVTMRVRGGAGFAITKMSYQLVANGVAS